MVGPPNRQMCLDEVGEWPDRKGVLYAKVDVPEFGKVVLKDVVIMSTRWWSDFMSGISVIFGDKALRPILYYSAYRLMKQHNQRGLIRKLNEYADMNSLDVRRKMFNVAAEVFACLGFGRIEEIELDENHIRAVVKESFEARGRKSSAPVCHFVAGVIAALIEDIYGLRIGPVREERCSAMGAESCLFVAELMEESPNERG